MNIFDGHTDILADVVARRSAGEVDVIRRRHEHKLQSGHITGGNFVLWMDPAKATMAAARNSFFHIEQELASLEALFHPVKLYADFFRATTTGKTALVLGMEGLSAMGSDLSRIEWLHQKGVRCASLTWNESNELATGIDGEASRGLTQVGKSAVKELEQAGILLDLSHLNETSFWEVIRMAEQPLMASHSNAKALCQHPRNLEDDQIKAIGSVGGVVGVNAWPDFLHHREPAVDHYVEQIDYLVSLVGIDGVILGFDFCDFMPPDPHKEPDQILETASLENASRAQTVIQKLAGRGYVEQDLEKIAWKNMLRVYQQTMK